MDTRLTPEIYGQYCVTNIYRRLLGKIYSYVDDTTASENANKLRARALTAILTGVRLFESIFLK